MGKNQKFDESSFVLTPIQMGARVYIPGIGRFLSVDLQEGGGDNNYVYPGDPVNEFDLEGKFSHWRGLSQIGIALAVTAGTGLACALTAGAGCVVAAAIIGAAGGAGSNVVGQAHNGRKFNYGSLIADTAIGGTLGAIGGKGISSQNNILRVGKGRMSVGPAPGHYGDGRIGSKIPVHAHLEIKKGGINFHKSNVSKKLYGNWKPRGR